MMGAELTHLLTNPARKFSCPPRIRTWIPGSKGGFERALKTGNPCVEHGLTPESPVRIRAPYRTFLGPNLPKNLPSQADGLAVGRAAPRASAKNGLPDQEPGCSPRKPHEWCVLPSTGDVAGQFAKEITCA